MMIGYNGPRLVDLDDPKTLPFGYLPGNIAVYLDNIAEAYGQAVGPLPQAPLLMQPGEMKATYAQVSTNYGLTTTEIPTSWTYDPGPNDFNVALNAEYATAVQGWNDRAAVVKQVLDVLLEQLKITLAKEAKEKPRS